MGSHRHIVSISHIPHICPTCLIPSSIPRWLPRCLRMGHYAHSRSHLAGRGEGPLRAICDQRWDKAIQSWIPTEVQHIHAIQCSTSDTILLGAVVCQILVHGTLLPNQCQGQVSPYLVVRGPILYSECLHCISGRYRIQMQFGRVGVYHQWEQLKSNPVDLPWHWTTAQCPQPHHVHYENRMFWANCAGDVITDLMSGFICKNTQILSEPFKLTLSHVLVLSIPFFVLWKTRISLRKKLILLSIFSATIFIMVTAMIRVAVGMNYDRQMNIDWLCFWSFVEVDVGMLSQAFVRLSS